MFLTALAIATAPITHPPDDSDALLLLDHKDLHDRWKPRTHHDALVSVYQMWNVLDRMNFATLHNHSLPWIYGYLRPVQLEALLQVVRSAGVSEYCEVGFNGGHSAVAVLTGAPNVSVRSFDNSAYGAHTKHNARCTPERRCNSRQPRSRQQSSAAVEPCSTQTCRPGTGNAAVRCRDHGRGGAGREGRWELAVRALASSCSAGRSCDRR